MPAVVHGTGKFTISPGAGSALIITTTWPAASGPNHGPVFAMADPDPGQEIQAILITYDYSKCRHAPEAGKGGPGTHEVFYQYKVRSESLKPVKFSMEYYDTK